MARPKNKSSTVQFTVSPSEAQAALLRYLAEEGLRGKNEAEVILYFVTKELERLRAEGQLPVDPTPSLSAVLSKYRKPQSD